MYFDEHFPRPVTLRGNGKTANGQLYLGQGAMGVEIIIFEADAAPKNQTMRALWKDRKGNRPAPVVLVAFYDGNKATVCGASGEDPPCFDSLDKGQVSRLCEELLQVPDRNAALRLFGASVETLKSPLPALGNEGFLSNHELAQRVPSRPDWPAALSKAQTALGQKGPDLLRGLGFISARCDNQTSFLLHGEQKVALAVLLEASETPEGASSRFSNVSPISYAMTKADAENIPYVIVVSGAMMRVYPTALSVGVGRRGRTETYLQVHTALLPDDKAGYLWLLFSAEALARGGSLEEIIQESNRYAGNLADDLRERIYQKVVPGLAASVVKQSCLVDPGAPELKKTYETALVILFRLLFVAYGEDKDLLPYRVNGLYQRNSLKEIARELLQVVLEDRGFGEGTVYWNKTLALFRAIDKGKKEWGVPLYNGGLFSGDAADFSIGAEIDRMDIPDKEFGPALASLLLTLEDGEMGPVDFASLGVREFGTIYEGLLESELSLAEQDLGLDKDNNFVPVKSGKPVVVSKGEVYLHNSSGARKSSGSYFTKDFAVQYLITKNLVPTLHDHFGRLDALGDADASLAFFDFRIADISMGSGHFLIAAIDRMEAEMTAYLSRRVLPGVKKELALLREAAHSSLGEIASQLENIEDDQILRRLIARRCIYGVDINPISVQLARLAVWIHTFVPGLPLSLLDRNLIVGNSLVGVGTVDEIKSRFERVYAGDDRGPSLFSFDTDALLAKASEPLKRLATIMDATHSDILRAKKAALEADLAVQPAKALCDIITALPLLPSPREISTEPADVQQGSNQLKGFFGSHTSWEMAQDNIVGSPAHKRAQMLLTESSPVHFPIAFPEVFLRPRGGFDVILGNPPWEKVKLEEKNFWVRYQRGIKSLTQSQYERWRLEIIQERPDLVELLEAEKKKVQVLSTVLSKGADQMGSGDPDLYKAFTWRFWNLVRAGSGRIGVVIPRSGLAGEGSMGFRKSLFSKAAGVDCCVLLNTGRWAFDMEPRYTIALLGISKAEKDKSALILRGPYSSLAQFSAGIHEPVDTLGAEEVHHWNPSLSFPLLPRSESIGVFRQLRKSPDLVADLGDDWKVRPYREMDATNDKPLMDLSSEDCPRGFWPVFKGESFNLWEPDTGLYYAWADPGKALDHLYQKRLRTYTRESSPFFGISSETARDPQTMPAHRPRIAFRDIARATDNRTVITALVPPGCFLTHKAPFWVFTRGKEVDEAFLLGVTSSMPFDWYARRYVEINATFFLVNHFPVPRPDKDCPLRKQLIKVSARLAAVDERFKSWAGAVGVSWGPLGEEEKAAMVHEIDALAAKLYGLTEDQLVHIYETFHEGADYGPRCRAVLEFFKAL